MSSSSSLFLSRNDVCGSISNILRIGFLPIVSLLWRTFISSSVLVSVCVLCLSNPLHVFISHHSIRSGASFEVFSIYVYLFVYNIYIYNIYNIYIYTFIYIIYLYIRWHNTGYLNKIVYSYTVNINLMSICIWIIRNVIIWYLE